MRNLGVVKPWLVLLGTAVISMSWLVPASAEAAEQVGTASSAPATTKPQTATAKPEVVQVGAVPITIYGVDLQEGTYFGDFYVWYRWKGPIDPVSTTQVINNVEKWGTTLTPRTKAPVRQPDGYLLQALRLDGRFDNNYSIGRYPLDVEKLYLTFENTTYASDQIVYQPAPASELQYEDGLQVQGWKVGDWTAKASTQTYKSHLGEPTKNNTYSTATFALELGRPSSFFLWKLLLPLGVVLMMGLAALLVSGESTDVRIALPSTAILAAVFLQLTYTEDLPTVTGLVLMDGLYAISYLALAAVLGRVIYAGYATRRHLKPGYSTRRGDLITLGVVGTATVVGMILAAILSR